MVFQFLFFLKIFLDFISFIVVCFIPDLSSGVPFSEHFIGNISNYYVLDPNTYTPFKNRILSSNETLNYIYEVGNIEKKANLIFPKIIIII